MKVPSIKLNIFLSLLFLASLGCSSIQTSEKSNSTLNLSTVEKIDLKKTNIQQVETIFGKPDMKASLDSNTETVPDWKGHAAPNKVIYFDKEQNFGVAVYKKSKKVSSISWESADKARVPANR